MEVGTIDSLEEDKGKDKSQGSARTKSPGARSGGSDDGGKDGKGGGGDEGGRRKDDLETPNVKADVEKSRVLMWVLLLIVLMTFGALISAYVVLSANGSLEWRPFALPFQVWISTAIIFLSSFTYDLGRRALKHASFDASKRWFGITTALGGMFVSSQILTWLALVDRGLYMAESTFAGFFYLLTAVHALHVIGGISALGYILLRTWSSPASKKEQDKSVTDATVIGWYWHTMDGLWLVLLFLLGFWK